MQSTDLQVLATARRWAGAGHRIALATVVRTWGSAPRPPGSWLVLRDDGMVEGSVSGGCIEDDLIDRMADGRMNGITPFTLMYGISRDEATRFGLPCGGTLELVIEPAPELALLDELADRLARRERVHRYVEVGVAQVSLAPALRCNVLSWDGTRLSSVLGPQWRLLIIGAGQISRYLSPMAQALDYEVIVCDPREEYHSHWSALGTRIVTTMPDDTVLELELDERCAVVALTHDPKLDDMALLEALKSPAFYVGAVGSRINNKHRRERLVEHFDLTDGEVDRLHGPVGLAIGSHTPPEIAVAILAEMIATRNLPATIPVNHDPMPSAQFEDNDATASLNPAQT